MQTKKKAFVTGITGQDGSYLAEFLLRKGYEVHGLVRRSSTVNIDRLGGIYTNSSRRKDSLFLRYGDLAESSAIDKIIEEVQPDEVYNLGAQSHVGVSFKTPEYTADVVGLGALRVLEALRNYAPKARFYQASSSEMFGKVAESPQTETTVFHPRSPYGCAKVFGYWITVNYRESYGMFACNGILFNHESPRRGESFVTRKITQAVARIKLGKQRKLLLGNLAAHRDWGFAGDYVKAMWLMLQQEKPDDYVIASGETHTVREFAELAFKEAGIDIVWRGKGPREEGVDKKTGKVLVGVDPQYFRPAEVDFLVGDSSKARKALGWKPKVNFRQLIAMMVKEDLKNEEKNANRDS